MNVALEVSTVGLGQVDKKAGYNRTGIYRVTCELSKALLRNSNVDVAVFFWAFPYTQELGLEYYRRNGYEVRSIFSNSALENVIYKAIHNTTTCPYKLDILKTLSKMFRVVRDKHLPESTDVVHSLYYPNPSFVSPRKTLRFRTIHDIIPLLFPQFFTERHRKVFLRNIGQASIEHDWYFCGSQSTKDDLCSCLGISEDRIFVNPFGASTEMYYREPDEEKTDYVRKKLNIPEGEYFLSVGTMEPRKNLNGMLRCFKRVVTTSNIVGNYFLVLVGREGWLVDKLAQRIGSDPLLREHVILPGFIPDELLSPLYSGALAFLFPSFYEGFGLPVLEAMQCGVPVITSNTSSLPEVVGDAGIQIDPSNEDDLCQAMMDIINNSALRADLSRKGVERAKLFSWEKCAERTVAGYRHALDHR